jgi:uncharacterized membrane protein
MTTNLNSVLKSATGKTGALVSGIFAISGLAYLVPKIFASPDVGAWDFRMVWLAGKLWAEGRDAYGPPFEQAYLAAFGTGFNMYWVYPPYWYPLAIPFGIMSYPAASLVWNLFNFLLLVAGSHLVAAAIASRTKQSYWPLVFTGLGLVCFMQATAIALSIGQTSILVYFGFCALAYGLLMPRALFVVIGLLFLALKPQVGIVAFVAVMGVKGLRWTALAAGALCLAATAPLLMTGSYVTAVREYLDNLARYPHETGTANAPPNLVGLTQLLDYARVMPVDATANVMVVVFAMVIGFAIFALFPPSDDDGLPERGVASVGLFIAAAVFFVPLHVYDIIPVAVLVMMIFSFPKISRWIVALGLLLCIRARNVAGWTGIENPNSDHFSESLMASVAMLLVLIGAVWAAAQLSWRPDTGSRK